MSEGMMAESDKQFRCALDIAAMTARLREKVPGVEWRRGDSTHDGFYVLGHTAEKVKVKIMSEDEDGLFHLGIYFYASEPRMDSAEREKYDRKMRRGILGALGAS